MRQLILCLLLLAPLAGCGGGSSSSGNIIPIVNTDRAGTWSGRETDAVSGQSGTMQIVVGADHSITGTWITDAGVTWTITGTVNAIPTATIPSDYTAMPVFHIAGQNQLSGSGTLQVNGITGHLFGPIMATVDDTGFGPPPPVKSLKFTIDLQRQ